MFNSSFHTLTRKELCRQISIQTTEDRRSMTIIYYCYVKFGYSEKTKKFEKIIHLKFDVTEYHQIISRRFFQILWPSQNIRTLNDQSGLQSNTFSKLSYMYLFSVLKYAANYVI